MRFSDYLLAQHIQFMGFLFISSYTSYKYRGKGESSLVVNNILNLILQPIIPPLLRSGNRTNLLFLIDLTYASNHAGVRPESSIVWEILKFSRVQLWIFSLSVN